MIFYQVQVARFLPKEAGTASVANVAHFARRGPTFCVSKFGKFKVPSDNNRLPFIYSFIHVLLEAVTSVVPGEDPSMVYTAMGQFAQHRQTNLDYSHERHF